MKRDVAESQKGDDVVTIEMKIGAMELEDGGEEP